MVVVVDDAGPQPEPEVCTKLQTKQTTDHNMDGSTWAIVEFQCQPSGRTYEANTCILGCPPGFVDPPPPADPAPDPADPAPAPPTPEQLLYAVYADLPTIAPDYQVEPEEPVVGVPAFLHVPDLAVRTASDSAGPLTVTVTATPVDVLWEFGDRAWTCPNGGAPYTEDRLDRALDDGGLVAEDDLCTYLFEVSSTKAMDGPYPSSVRTVWDYSWSINGVDQGIFNAGLASSPTTFDLTVTEIQAVVTNG